MRLQRELLQTEYAMGQWLHISPAVCRSPWYRLKAIPASRRVCVQVLCSLAREGGCSLLCLGLWKFLRKLQMCWYCINFLISDPNESFVLFFKLFRNVFFHCYAAIASPAMRGQNGKYQQFIIWFFLLNVSNCLQPMCLSVSVVWCHILFSCL